MSLTEERRALIVLLTVIFLMISGFGLVIPLLPFFARAFNAPAWQVTLLFSAFSVGQFLGENVWGRLSDRIGRRPVLIVTIAMVGLSYAALAFAPNMLAAFAIRFANGFFAGNISTLQGALADITAPEKRAGRMGIMGAAFSAGFTTGPAIGGLLAQPSRGALGFQLPLLVAAGFALASALAVVVLVRESRPKSAPAIGRRVKSARLREGFAHPIISRVAPLPLVAIHSTKDEFVPVEEVRRVMATAGEPKQLWIVTASDHRFSDNQAGLQQRLFDALAWIAERR